jgi:uncharacterized protein (UPF0335 family)
MFYADNVYFHKNLTMYQIKDYSDVQFFDAWKKKVKVDYLEPAWKLINKEGDLMAATLILASAVDIMGTFLFSTDKKLDVKVRMNKILELILNKIEHLENEDKIAMKEIFYTKVRSGVVHGGSTSLFPAFTSQDTTYKDVRVLIYIPTLEDSGGPLERPLFLSKNDNLEYNNLWFNPNSFFKYLDKAFVTYCNMLSEEEKKNIGKEIKSFYFSADDIKKPTNHVWTAVKIVESF